MKSYQNSKRNAHFVFTLTVFGGPVPTGLVALLFTEFLDFELEWIILETFEEYRMWVCD